MNESGTENDAPKKGAGGLPGLRKTPPEKSGKHVPVKGGKRMRLKRVAKAKPAAGGHVAEPPDAPTLTDDKPTAAGPVVKTMAGPTYAKAKARVAKTFKCFECGAKVPCDSDRCPKCRSLYLRGLKEEDVDEMLRAEQADDGGLDEIIRAARLPVVHFDAETGVMRLLEPDKDGPGVVLECAHCGALVEAGAGRCPICRASLKASDTGLAGLFNGMEFDQDPLDEADCPFCGEHVMLVSGECPSCGMAVAGDAAAAADKVMPILQAENVVFVHLDIETGEVSFLRRANQEMRYEQASVQLEGVGTDGLDQD